MVLGIVVEQIARHGVSDNVLANFCAELIVGYFRRMLRRDDYRIDPERAAVAVLNRNL